MVFQEQRPWAGLEMVWIDLPARMMNEISDAAVIWSLGQQPIQFYLGNRVWLYSLDWIGRPSAVYARTPIPRALCFLRSQNSYLKISFLLV